MLILLLVLIVIYLITKPEKSDVMILFKKKKKVKQSVEKRKRILSPLTKANVLLISPDKQESEELQPGKL